MTDKRFINIDGEVLYDRSGKMEAIYHNERVYFKELCDFLNEMDEENQKLQRQLNTYKSGNILLKSSLDKYKKVMSKYEIGSVEKLDKILMEQRVW